VRGAVPGSGEGRGYAWGGLASSLVSGKRPFLAAYGVKALRECEGVQRPLRPKGAAAAAVVGWRHTLRRVCSDTPSVSYSDTPSVSHSDTPTVPYSDTLRRIYSDTPSVSYSDTLRRI